MNNSTYLNPVELVTGEKFTFTAEGLKHIKPLVKKFTDVDFEGEFFIIQIRETMGAGTDSEENSEQDELVTGAEIIKCVKTNKVLDLSGNSNEDYWAFFTNITPHLFTIKE